VLSLSSPEKVANTAMFLTKAAGTFARLETRTLALVGASVQQRIRKLPQTFFTVNHLPLFFQQ
jgi:hypothetical protein